MNNIFKFHLLKKIYSKLFYTLSSEIGICAFLSMTILITTSYISKKLIWDSQLNSYHDKIHHIIEDTFTVFMDDMHRSITILNSVIFEKQKLFKTNEINKIMKFIKYAEIIVDKNTEVSDIISLSQQYFDTLVIKKSITSDKAIFIKIDLEDLITELNSRIDNKAIRYAIYNSSKTLLITNNKQGKDIVSITPTVLQKKVFDKVKLQLYVWIDEQFLVRQKEKIIQNTIFIICINILLLALIYTVCKRMLKTKLFYQYIEQLNNLQHLLDKAKEAQVLSVQYQTTYNTQREFLDNMLIGTKVMLRMINRQLAEIQLSPEEAEYKSDSIREIRNHLDQIAEFKILWVTPEVINIREVLEKSIAYWVSEIKRKDIILTLNECLGTTLIKISKISLYQLMVSIIGIIIFSLPKGKKLTITVLSNNSKNITILFEDNGFGISLEDIPKYHEDSKESAFICSWRQLVQMMKDMEINYQLISHANQGNKVSIFIPFYQETENNITQDNTNVIHFQKYKK